MAFLHSFSVAIALLLSPSVLMASGSPAHFLSELEKGRRQKIVVYGTSLTANAAWPAGLQATLRASYGRKPRVVNAALGGMDSRWGLAHFTERVIREKPDAVCIEFAINDALATSKLGVSESMGNLEEMIRLIRRERPDCEVMVMVMNPPTGDALRQRPRILDYEDGYRRVAKRNECRFINFARVWRPIIARQPARWKSYAPDGLHPTERASREVILPYLLEKIGFTHPPAGS